MSLGRILGQAAFILSSKYQFFMWSFISFAKIENQITNCPNQKIESMASTKNTFGSYGWYLIVIIVDEQFVTAIILVNRNWRFDCNAIQQEFAHWKIFKKRESYFCIVVIAYPLSTMTLWRNDCLTLIYQYWVSSECHYWLPFSHGH